MKDKDNALKDYVEMTKASWTYNKMTLGERNRLFEMFNSAPVRVALKGSYKHRWDILQVAYTAYLDGIGYTNMGWRD